jgi:monoamine oxidase
MSKKVQVSPLFALFAVFCALLVGCCSLVVYAQSSDVRVVVVGGGLAGLTTAYELQKRGIVAHVIEANEVFGGRVATAHYPEGLQAEFGLQELWAENPALTIARELHVPLDEEGAEPFSSVVIDGKLHAFIQDTSAEYFASFLSEAEQTALSAWFKKASVIRKSALARGLADPTAKALQDLSFAEWIAQEKLPRRAAEFIRLTLECELATTWDRFSALAGLIEFGIFLDGGQKNYHVRGGNVRLIEALAAALKGPKTLSALVVRVVREKGSDGKVRAHVYYRKAGRIEKVDADAVVLAIPFTRIHVVSLTPALSQTKRQAIESLSFGQYVVAHLIVDRAAEKLWSIEGETPLPVLTDGRLGVVYGMQGEGDPKAKTDVFALLIHGPAARRLHMKPHDEAVAEMVAELSRLWPGFDKYVRASYLYSHHPAAVAVWPPGRSPLDAQAQSLFEPEEGLYLAGDWLVSAHSDGAVISGQRAAERIAKDLRTLD